MISEQVAKPSFWRSLGQKLRDSLPFIFQVAPLITVAGFFVVHTYLSKVTGIFTYEINPVVYFAAGLNMIPGVIFGVLQLALGSLSWIIIGTIVGIILAIIFIGYNSWKLHKINQMEKLDGLLDNFGRWSFRLSYSSLIVLAVLIGIIYGYNFYESSPRALGGGAPAWVVLVFKPLDDFSLLGLPLTMDDNYDLRSQPVTLLMELRNGLLVRDPQKDVSFIVRDDALYAILDAWQLTKAIVSPQIQPTLTLQPPLNLTVTPNATP